VRVRGALRATPALGLALASLAALAGCAQRGLPPGGPVDDTAPTVLSIPPADGLTAVPPGTAIRITFSEPMDHGSVHRALRIFPEPGPVRTTWNEQELTVETPPGAPAGSSGERIATLLTEAVDRRGNRLEAAFEAAWSEGERLPHGSISGSVRGGSGRTPPRVLLFLSPGPPLDSLAAIIPLRETSPDVKGAFRIAHLPDGDGALYALFALRQDRPRPELDPGKDLIAVGPDSIALSGDRADTAGIELTLVKPDADGTVSGLLPPPAEGATLRLEAAADTLFYEAEPDSSGRFTLESVRPGRYRMVVVRGAGGEEPPPPDWPASIRVRPGEKVVLPGGAEPDSIPATPASADTSAARPDSVRPGEKP
jgi:hypothetical protein